MIKVMVVVKRKAGISREKFYKYWKNVHGPLVAKHMPGMRKYVQNHFIEVPGHENKGDGIIEMWYDDIASWKKSMGSNKTETAKPLIEDWAKIADINPLNVWVAEEHVIKDETGKGK